MYIQHHTHKQKIKGKMKLEILIEGKKVRVVLIIVPGVFEVWECLECWSAWRVGLSGTFKCWSVCGAWVSTCLDLRSAWKLGVPGTLVCWSVRGAWSGCGTWVSECLKYWSAWSVGVPEVFFYK